MQKLSYKIISFIVLLSAISQIINAQTNVSGGIYSNTTWTLANSPYIVVDTIVVFPGVTLSIEPGVVVKFANNKRLEIRQAYLIAEGTNSDSITFTSNATVPSTGIWSEIWLNSSQNSKFKFCNFRYSDNGIRNMTNYIDTLYVKNSKFEFNNYGISNFNSGQTIGYCIIDSCKFEYNDNSGFSSINSGAIDNTNFSHNQTGIHIQWHPYLFTTMNNCVIEFNQTGLINEQNNNTFLNCSVGNNETGIYSNNIGFNVFRNCRIDSNLIVGIHFGWSGNDLITKCLIRYNGIGFKDDMGAGSPVINTITENTIDNNGIGLYLSNWKDTIYCNRICGNTTSDLHYNVTFNYNTIVANNYWCSSDSISTTPLIYDGYDNISLGLVAFMPIDTQLCYLMASMGHGEHQDLKFNFYPNPLFNSLTLNLPVNVSKAEIRIYSLLGEVEFFDIIEQNSIIDVSGLSSGIHIIEVEAGNTISRKKLIKQKTSQ